MISVNLTEYYVQPLRDPSFIRRVESGPGMRLLLSTATEDSGDLCTVAIKGKAYEGVKAAWRSVVCELGDQVLKG